MRSFLILFLLGALLLAAAVTRPGKREFMLFLLDSPGKGEPWSSTAVKHAEGECKGVVFNNRVLWTDVIKDGKTIYTGLFAHYVPRGEKLQPTPSPAELAKLLAHAK